MLKEEHFNLALNKYVSIYYMMQNVIYIRQTSIYLEWISFRLNCSFFFIFGPLKLSQVFAVQHVDVCMFSNGKFKNVVADVNESYQIKAGESYRKEYTLLPLKGM